MQQRVAQLEQQAETYLKAAQSAHDGHRAAVKYTADLQADHARVLGLVQALPKCEGELEIAPFGGYHGISWYTGNGSCVTMGRFRSAEEAYAYKAMLAYRASLPA